MTNVHIAVGIALFTRNLFAGAWGLVAWLSKRPSPGFWYLLRAAQGAVVLQAFIGAILLIRGLGALSDLHYLYGVLPVAIMLVTEAMRVGAAQRVVGDTDYAELPEPEAQQLALQIFVAETRVMALGCLIIAALAIRAGESGGFIG